MVKLTPELIEQSYQFTNPVRDRELDLRGYKIPVIENLGATLDQFDTLDLSDNDIRKLDGFPYLSRLKCILLNNNRITRLSESLHDHLPNLDTLVLTNNNLQELGDLDSLSSLTNLTSMSLIRNPVSAKKYYRLYAIHKIPSLRTLDFQRVKQRERDAAAKMFKGRKGKVLAAEMAGNKVKTFVPGGQIPVAQTIAPQRPKQDMDAIKKAIANAKTLDEVERLNKQLQAGQVPGAQGDAGVVNGRNGHEEMEAD